MQNWNYKRGMHTQLMKIGSFPNCTRFTRKRKEIQSRNELFFFVSKCLNSFTYAPSRLETLHHRRMHELQQNRQINYQSIVFD